jgi:flagellar protein FliS
MPQSDPYGAYIEGQVLDSDPVHLVVALYEGAIDATRRARTCLETGDIWSRSKATSKAMNILIELSTSLDHQKGGVISYNLARLYRYMQQKLMEGHAQKKAEAYQEVERLLETLLEAWRKVAKERSTALVPALAIESRGALPDSEPEAATACYADYFADTAAASPGMAFLF